MQWGFLQECSHKFKSGTFLPRVTSLGCSYREHRGGCTKKIQMCLANIELMSVTKGFKRKMTSDQEVRRFSGGNASLQFTIDQDIKLDGSSLKDRFGVS